MYDLVINSTLQHTLLLFIPLIFALVLKSTKIRAWAMLGGVAGGVLLGPAVLGAVAPDYWERVFQGGVHERQEILQLQRQQETDILAAQSLHVNESVILQMRADQQYEVDQVKKVWATAMWKEQRTLRDYAMLLVVLILFIGSMRSYTKGTAPPLMSLSVGMWATIVPSGAIALIAYKFWNTDVPSALAIGACLGVGPWTLASWEQRTANQCEQDGALLMLRCGRVAWCFGIAIALYATWQLHSFMALVWLLPLILLPVIWLIPTRKFRLISIFVDYCAIPSVMATSLVLTNPLEQLKFWPILLVILLCADARWLGGIIGLGILGGRNSSSAMKLSIPLVDAGVSQLCMVVLLFGAGVLPAPLALAVIIGAVFLETTTPMRQSFAAN